MFAHPSRRRFFHLAASAALSLRSSSSWCEESAGKKPANAKSSDTPAKGPLRLHPKNPRYFTDGSGKAIYLTGAHTWYNLQDMGLTDPPPVFDFGAHLTFVEKHHHNFMRMWRWELARWTESKFKGVRYCASHPWKRTGPEKALDGKPKFDLHEFDPAYFDRLRSRVEAAGERGTYVSIMLFEGWGLSYASWDGHPFNVRNNVQGINGDPDGDGKGRETHTLAIPAVTRIQEAYVRKVIDTVNDLGNVLYEIANESGLYSTKWQYHMIRYVKTYQSKKAKQHPVGMTSDGYGGEDDTDRLFASPADWISPSPDRDDYKGNPPASTGTKVILLDTDHLWGVGGDRNWVWKSFLRGHNPIWMDAYDKSSVWEPVPGNAEDVRRTLGDARRYAEKMNLAALVPRNDLASTKYCLANPGSECLVYQPQKGAFEVTLADGTYDVEWFNPATGARSAGDGINAGIGKRRFIPPFHGPAVLYLKRKG